MASYILIGICALLLLSYFFDITAQKSKIPSVILLLLVGWLLKKGLSLLGYDFPDLEPVLPLLGTTGLVLIVLEGALELKWSRETRPTFTLALISACIQIIVPSILLGFSLSKIFNVDLHLAIVNIIPLTIISSAIVIPSSRALSENFRSFLTIESTLSDVLGILIFNLLLENKKINSQVFLNLTIDLSLIILISIVSIWILVLLMDRIHHHVKFLPIILTLLLIYSLTKELHLPSLFMVLLFGLLLGNLDIIKPFQKLFRFHHESVSSEIPGFKRITGELTFLVRSLFFLSFGSSINLSELSDTSILITSVSVLFTVTIIRLMTLRLLSKSFLRLWIYSPKGLITVLLFLSIPQEQQINEITKSVVILVTLGSILLMFFNRKNYGDTIND